MGDNHGNRPDFQVDEILEEARRKKIERLKNAEFPRIDTSGRVAPAVGLGTLNKEKEAEKASEPAPADNNIKEPVVKPAVAIDNSATRKVPLVDNISNQIQNSHAENAQKSEDAPDDEQVKIYEPKPSSQTTEKISAPEDTEQDDELDQIRLDSFFEENPDDEQAGRAEDWEEQFQRERRKKAENFKLQSPVALRLSGEEEDNDPAEEPDRFEDEEIEDFCSYEDAEAVRSELVYRRRTGWLQLILTSIFTLTLFVSAVLYYLNWESINPVLFIGFNLFLMAITALLNHRSFGDGLKSLIRFKADTDSIITIVVSVTLINTILQFLNIDVVTGGKAVILTPVAATALFLGALGRQMLIIRVVSNFRFVSYRQEKYAAHIVENRKTASEIGRAAVAIGDPIVCYLEKTDFLTRFLENSYDPDTGSNALHIYVPCALGASAVLAAVFGIMRGSIIDTLTVFASAVCISLPIGALTAVNFPVLRSARRLLRHGAMLVGWRAAEEFGDIHALATDALEVFPSESVLLHGIKTFAGARIDEAILDAAAVSIAAGGPLSSVFRRIIQNRTDILKEVDTLVYEQDMGMSGWVGGRRVLIGNRRLLENHGVDVPSRDYEARYTKDNRRIVYLSTAGELSAMFVISYVADQGIAKALKGMCKSGITLLVRTCDPNVTEELICQEYDLDPYYVEVMAAPAGRSYDQLLLMKSEENEAVLASNGRLEGTAFGITYCRRLLKAVRLAMIVQIIGGALGLSIAVVMSLYTGVMLTPLLIAAYTSIWTLLSWLIPGVYRV
jgi:cation transport ATPase